MCYVSDECYVIMGLFNLAGVIFGQIILSSG